MFLLFWFLWELRFWRKRKKKESMQWKLHSRYVKINPFMWPKVLITILGMWFFFWIFVENNMMSSPWCWKKIWVVRFIECYCFGYSHWAQPIKQRRDVVTIFCGCYVICVLHSLFLTLRYKVFLIFSWWTLYLWTY
jgi:hypothetical protein